MLLWNRTAFLLSILQSDAKTSGQFLLTRPHFLACILLTCLFGYVIYRAGTYCSDCCVVHQRYMYTRGRL